MGLDDLKPRQMKLLKLAEENKSEGIWIYKLKEDKDMGKHSISTLYDDITKLSKLGYLQKLEEGERKKQPYVLAPGLHVVTSRANPVDIPIKTMADMPIKTMASDAASHVSVVVRSLASVPGTVLYYLGSAFITSSANVQQTAKTGSPSP
jgi:hypothetical protein